MLFFAFYFILKCRCISNQFEHMQATSWHKRLGARLPPLGSRVRVSVTPCGFRGGWNGVWVGFSRGFSRFPLPQISFHLFSTLIASISFHFIRPCDGASGVVGRHSCYPRTYNIGASSHLIPRPDLVLDTSWGYLFIWRQYTCRVSAMWNNVEQCVTNSSRCGSILPTIFLEIFVLPSALPRVAVSSN